MPGHLASQDGLCRKGIVHAASDWPDSISLNASVLLIKYGIGMGILGLLKI